jgi:hypothetical protein
MVFDQPMADCQLLIWVSIGMVLHPRLYSLGAAEKELCIIKASDSNRRKKTKKGDPKVNFPPVLDNPETKY